jgi:NAD(P)-dependent dehydrogenase (short-subunit alcohol dehydrogenase family)
MQAAYQAGVAELGPVDIVLGNAGICQLGGSEPDPAQAFNDVGGVNLIGVWNSVYVAAHDMIDRGKGGAIVLGETGGQPPQRAGRPLLQR